ncbi:MAG: hypothetical protein IPH59_16625 [bacterium]|nr:hypothetical protein [bacterium]
MQVFQWLKALAAFAVLLIVSSEVCAFDNSLSRASIKEHQQNESLGYNSLAKELAGQEAEMSITLEVQPFGKGWQTQLSPAIAHIAGWRMAWKWWISQIRQRQSFYTGIPTRHSTQNLR